MMSRLIWQLPLFMVVTALIDLLLVLVYMNWLHPWRGILEDVSMNLIFNLKLVLQRSLGVGDLPLTTELPKSPFRVKTRTAYS